MLKTIRKQVYAFFLSHIFSWKWLLRQKIEINLRNETKKSGLAWKKIRAGLKKIRACPFSEATGPGLVHKKYFLGALPWVPVLIQQSVFGFSLHVKRLEFLFYSVFWRWWNRSPNEFVISDFAIWPTAISEQKQFSIILRICIDLENKLHN